MWNVVTIGGENYIADLTNSDGDKSSYDKLFMVGAKDYYGDYRVETNAGNYTFSYKESDGNNYNDSYLAADLVITSNVAKKDNSWTTELTVTDVLFGDTIQPQAAAAVGEVSFLYSSTEDGEYTSDVPTEIGTWYVKAVVAESEEYKALESAPVSFQILERTQYTNSWEEELTASDSVYGSELNVSAKSAYGTVKYLYAAEENGTFTEEAPKNVGTWYVKAVVDTTDDYTGLESEAVSFEITKAENSWKTELSIKDINEGLKPAPKAEASFGKSVFQYSSSAAGTFSETVPTKAGTYYVKAVVAETENYSGLESEVVSFKINTKAADPETEVPYVNDKDSATVNLNEQNLKIFNEARKQIREIAAGDRAYAILEINVADTLDIDVDDSKYNASLSALGLTEADFDANGKASIDANIAWQKWAENRGYFTYYTKGGSSTINKALWAECAYDLYWHDRTVKGVGWWPITVYLKDDGTVGLTADSYIPGAFAVTAEYRADENSADEYRQYYLDHPNYGTPPNWDVDTTTAKSVAKTTVANAKKVVEAAKNLSDYEKLEYYADYILEAVSYDNDAAQHISDDTYELGNAWQVPYVFDNDSSTNIVCEGYAKAFKFLCDMTTFEDSTIDVRMVTGPCNMNGQSEDHMWNVVTYAGKNYIVDLTNSDEGSVGEVGTLFMVPASYTSWSSTYNLNGIYYPGAGEEGQSASRTSWSATYKYDDDANATFSAEDLEIARELPVSYTDAAEAGRAIAEQMKERKSRIVVQYTGSSSGLTGDVFTALRDLAYTHTGEAGLGDNLKRQVDVCVPATSGSSNVYIYNVEYFNDASLERQLEEEAPKVLESLNLEGKSDYQKARAIYNWLCRNVKYDESRTHTNLYRYSAAYAIVRKNAVCEGYANAFYYLASLAGLENRIVVSTDHSWNIVKLGEYYYNVDATWDASYYDPEAGYSASYSWRFFMKNDATYLQENYPNSQWGTTNPEHHTRLSYDTGDDAFRAAYPMSPTNYGETENGIRFKENNGTVTITGYTGDDTELIVPDTIAGEPVGTINANALSDEKLTMIRFTSDVENIAEGAFGTDVTLQLAENCTNLIKYAADHNIKTADVPIPQEENSWTKELSISDVEIGYDPEPEAEAAYGEVTYKYAAEEDGEYTETVPTAVGTWYVKAYVEEAAAYTGLESEAVSFKITKHQNAWKTTLSIEEIYVGETPAPKAEAQFGNVRFEYCKGWSGEFTDTLPDSSGYWSVRAVVDETEEYTGLEATAYFYVDTHTNSWTTPLTIKDITEGEELQPHAEAAYGEIVYEYSSNGYSWSQEAPVAAGSYYVRATVAEGDSYKGITSSSVRFTINSKVDTERIEELNAEIRNASSERDDAEVDHAAAVNAQVDAEAALEEQTAVKAEADQKAADADAALTAAEEKLTEINADADATELEKAEAALTKAETELAAAKANDEKKASDAAYEAAKAEADAKKADTDAKKAKIDEFNAQIKMLQAELAIAENGTATDELQNTLDQTTEDYNAAKDAYEAAVKASEEAAATAETKAAESEAAAEELKDKKHTNLENNVTAAQKTVNSIKNKQAAAKFTDVPSTAYYNEPVGWAVSNGITSGVAETSFAPAQNCTRAQMIVFLWNAAGQPDPKGTITYFSDVNTNKYYYKAVQWAAENGYVGVTENKVIKFNPDEFCTRAMAMTFIWNSVGKPDPVSSASFTDVKAGKYYEKAVNWAAENGVTSGYGNGIFRPEEICTRAQIVTFLYNFYN